MSHKWMVLKYTIAFVTVFVFGHCNITKRNIVRDIFVTDGWMIE